MAAVPPVLVCTVVSVLENAVLLARSVTEYSVTKIQETSVRSETVFRTEVFTSKRII